jgi:ABC-2 type transport system ATP-binding protein
VRERESAVVLEGVGKRYGSTWALKGVEFSVPFGAVTGLVGPNGAGKSTLLNIVAGLTRVSEGEGHVLGERISPSAAAHPFVGLMIEKPGFIEHLSGRRNLEMLASIRGRVLREGVQQSLRDVGLRPADRRPVRTYSQGMRQRLSLAQAVMEKPRLVVLDEPTNGLDPVAIIEMRRTVRDLAAGGTAVLLASHLLTEVEAVSDRVVMMDAGSSVRILSGTSGESHVRRVHIRVDAVSSLSVLASLPAITDWENAGERSARLTIDCPVPDLVRAVVQLGIGIEAVGPVEASLEETYLTHLGRAR